ncbi:MAG: putative dsRNA-binding protein, partial [Lautropia sp.]
GDLSRLRSNLVKQQTLYEIGQALSLGESLVLGEGERRSGGLRRPSILADTVEAIMGAIFLDADFATAAGVIERLYEPVLKSVDPKTLGKDAKTLLQEYLQGRRIPLPVYDVVATHGAAHSQVFEVECSIPKLSVSVSGSGGSRRAAEQAAAKLALEAAIKVQAAAPKRAKAAPAPAAGRAAKAAPAVEKAAAAVEKVAPAAEKAAPAAEKATPAVEKAAPAAERPVPAAEKAAGDKPAGEKPAADKQLAEKPSAEKATAEKVATSNGKSHPRSDDAAAEAPGTLDGDSGAEPASVAASL